MNEMKNAELEQARYIIERTGVNMFLTGKAGTGKTTFLKQLRDSSPKRMVVLAPTGIAAINAGGVTIHSFFQLAFAPFMPGTAPSGGEFYKMSKQKLKLIRSLDLIVIDEVSMVRADLLDNIDASLKWIRGNNNPFGGVQMLLIGDLQQLAPVVKDEEWEMLKEYYKTPYFFSSLALKGSEYVTVELKKVYRQQDRHFISMLNDIRDGNVSATTLDELNSHCKPTFEPKSDSGFIRLVTHNAQANAVNEREIARIPGKEYRYQAQVKGDFPESSFPTEKQLSLKARAQVMFLKNNQEKGYYNGMIGRVTEIWDDGFKVAPINGKGAEIEVERETWDNTKYKLNEANGAIVEKIEGQYEQFPVRLAWAITIHKSQGLTFEHALIDAHAAFAHGQVYVALSRCKTLEGLVLSAPITREAIICDEAIKNYCSYLANNGLDRQKLYKLGFNFFVEQVCRAFDFSQADRLLMSLIRNIQVNFGRTYADFSERWQNAYYDFKENIVEVAHKFQKQISEIAKNSNSYHDDPVLQQRIAKAANYFIDQLAPLAKNIDSFMLPTDNKEIKKRVGEIVVELDNSLRLSIGVMRHLLLKGFKLTDFLNERSRLQVFAEGQPQKAARAKRNADEGLKKPTAEDVAYPELYQTLSKWRAEVAKKKEVPAYVVLQQRALIGIADSLPQTKAQLLKIKCFGKVTFENYGEGILSIVTKFAQSKGISPQPDTPEKVTVKKVSSKQESLRLFTEGKNIDEIASERGLVQSTIFGHLISFLPSGKIKLEQLVAADKISLIKDYIANNHIEENGEPLTITQIKEGLGNAVSFNDIRAVMTSMDYN